MALTNAPVNVGIPYSVHATGACASYTQQHTFCGEAPLIDSDCHCQCRLPLGPEQTTPEFKSLGNKGLTKKGPSLFYERSPAKHPCLKRVQRCCTMAAAVKLLAALVVVALAGWPGAASGQGEEWEEVVGEGYCRDADGKAPNRHSKFGIATESACKAVCAKEPVCAGISYGGSDEGCNLYGTGLSRGTSPGPEWTFHTGTGTDDLVKVQASPGLTCLKKKGEAPRFSTHDRDVCTERQSLSERVLCR